MAFTYLLLVDFDGEKRGFSNREAQLVDEQHFGNGLLSLSVPVREAPLFGFAGSSDLSFSLSLDQRDIFALQQKGVRLQRSQVQLWAWLEGQTLDQAVEVFRGEMGAPSFDFTQGVFSARASAPAFSSDTAFPPGLVGDEGRFDSLTGDVPDSSKRLAVPVIYGTALGCPLVPLEPNPGGVNNARFLVAGHRVASTSLSLAVDGVTIVPLTAATVFTAVDDLGGTYSYIDVQSGDYDEGLYAESVDGKEAPGGGAIERLGDVLLDIWLSYGRGKFFDIDRERVYAAQPLLNRYKVGALFNARTEGQTVIDLLASRFEQQYPVVFGAVGGKFGWDAVFIPPDDAPPVLSLTMGQTVHDRGQWALTDVAQVRNRFEVQYGQDWYQNSGLSSLRLDDTNDGVCRGSVSRWGKSPLHSWQAGDAPDEGTAYLLSEDEARRLSKVRWRGTYGLADPSVLQLPLFGVVLVTDADLSWTEKRFLIERLTPRLDGRVDLGLVEL